MTDAAIVARLNAQMHEVMQPATSPAAELDPLLYVRRDGGERRLPHYLGHGCEECGGPESTWGALRRLLRLGRAA